MKNLKQIIVVGVSLVALSSQANWTVVAPNAVTVYPGASGVADYVYTPDINGTTTGGSTAPVIQTSPSFASWAGPGGAGNPITSYTIVSEPSTFTSGNPFTVVVDWTVSSTPIVSPEVLFVSFGITTSDGSQGTSQNFTIEPTPVPEPGQATAGCMLLACGGLVFVGRRLVAKRA